VRAYLHEIRADHTRYSSITFNRKRYVTCCFTPCLKGIKKDVFNHHGIAPNRRRTIFFFFLFYSSRDSSHIRFFVLFFYIHYTSCTLFIYQRFFKFSSSLKYARYYSWISYHERYVSRGIKSDGFFPHGIFREDLLSVRSSAKATNKYFTIN